MFESGPESGLEAKQAALRILQPISFTLHPGELVAVLGPNGAGKSTFLKLLSGEWRPASGEVLLEGRPLASWAPRDRARRLAVLPQHSLFDSAFTALEVALLGRTPHPPGADNATIARAALDAVEAAHLAAKPYTRLSGGEQQRVHLARVLAQIWEPATARFLLLDEPTANLDLSHQHRTLEIARRLAAEGAGVLAIMHDLNLASRYADRILMLKQGAVIVQGTPAEVLTAAWIEQVFAFRVRIVRTPKVHSRWSSRHSLQ